jgi:hypothetical protein
MTDQQECDAVSGTRKLFRTGSLVTTLQSHRSRAINGVVWTFPRANVVGQDGAARTHGVWVAIRRATFPQGRYARR